MPLSEPEGWEEFIDEKTGEKLQYVHIVTKITGIYPINVSGENDSRLR
jgi:hypothetical protein